MNEFYIYETNDFRVLLPSYLKPKRVRGLFAVARGKRNSVDIESLAIDLPYTKTRALDAINVLSSTRVFDWGNVKKTVIRSGDIFYKGEGFELLTESHNTETLVNVIRYDRVFCLVDNLAYAYAILTKEGIPDGFYDACCRIIESVELIGHT